jgi:cytochrome c biogenesis protein CcmG, thiol:disulfide interchange protein DsbE
MGEEIRTPGRRPWGLLTLGLAVVAASAAWLLLPGGEPSPPVTVGSAAPAFTASTVTEPPATRSLADYAGHPVILNFWATWCQPCREEMPSFERLYRDDGPRGLRIVAVSIDEPGAEEKIRSFVAQYALTFDVLHDPRLRIKDRYQVRGVPTSILISASERIVGTQFVRDWSSPASRALVDSLLLANRP